MEMRMEGNRLSISHILFSESYVYWQDFFTVWEISGRLQQISTISQLTILVITETS